MRDSLAWLGLCLYLAAGPAQAVEYLGERIGSLTTMNNSVAGDVYVVDNSKIRLIDFVYDGQGTDVFLYIGVDGRTTSSAPTAANGTRLADEQGGMAPLREYTMEDIVLSLPADVSVTDVKWLSVWSRNASADYGSLVFPSTYTVPQPKDIGQFSRLAHSVRSGEVTILDAKTIYIRDLYYDGAGPAAYFLVGTGDAPHSRGTKVADENGSLSKLKGYSGESPTVILPAGVTVHDIKWLSMYCIDFEQDFGHVNLPTEPYVVPPYLSTIGPQRVPLPNCLHLHDYLNVAWQVMGDHIILELTGALETGGGYMAFGVSGSSSRSAMVGADVAVVHYDEDNELFQVEDYKLTAYSMCSGDGEGACPDTARSGTNDFTLLSGSMDDGVTTVRYMRQLSPGSDTENDLTIPSDTSVYVVWALGKLTATSPFHVTKHDIRLNGDLQINFGETQSTSGCNAVVARGTEEVEAWSDLYISGENTKEFRVKIGQAGGAKGYSAITGKQSWGIAYYINGKLIPELYLKRGDMYTFIIEAGDDPVQSAKYHPFYIADDPAGGYSKKTDAEKEAVVVHTGVDAMGQPTDGAQGRYCEYEHTSTDQSANSATFDDFFNTLRLRCEDGEPGTFTWTPDAETPDLTYYQCWAHNYLGWKIHVGDTYPMFSSSTVTSLSTLTAIFFVSVSLLFHI